MSNSPKPIVLLILDGWGHRDATDHNAIAQANTPCFDHLWTQCPHTLLTASGEAVGLPRGQMGNSEVGHLNIGSGRTVYQDLTRISKAIEENTFQNNTVFIKAIDQVIQNDKAMHIFGLLSPGGIHSHEEHIFAFIRLCAQRGLSKIYVHAFLDGRDTPPKSAAESIIKLEKVLTEIHAGQIVSLIGRYYVMDRDQRWDRIQKAYDLFTLGKADHEAPNALEGLDIAYDAGETDEFIKPTSIHAVNKAPTTVQDGDSIIFMNFRADRAREITQTFIEKDFDAFPREQVVKLSSLISLTEYDQTFSIPAAFPPETLRNTLGEYLARLGKKQLRIAETEKYAHVTFFLNGGVEIPNKNEDRILIPSPKVSTYDLQPEMSAKQVTEKLIDALQSNQYDVIICNFANADMVGHTGNVEATVKAIECIDDCLCQIAETLTKQKGELLVTADHGNAEQMFDSSTKQPHTAHTTNPVPFIYMGRNANVMPNHFSLRDIAPTVLYLMGCAIPKEMTGTPIIQVQE